MNENPQEQPQEEMDKETRKKKLLDQMAKSTGANMPAPPPAPPQPPASEAAPQAQPEADPQAQPEAGPEEQGVQQLTPEQQQQMEEEQRQKQLSEALSYFGPRLAAQLMGGSDAMQITDKLLKDYDQHTRNIQDRETEKAKIEEEKKAKQAEYERKEEELNIKKQAEVRKQMTADEQKSAKRRQQLLGFSNLKARLKELELSEKRAATKSEQIKISNQRYKVEQGIKQINAFQKMPQVQKLKDQRRNIQDMESIIKDAPEIAPGILDFKVVKGIGGEVGNLNKQELDRAGISPSFQRKIERKISVFTTGRLPKADIEDYKKVIKLMGANLDKRMKGYIKNYAAGRRKYVPEKDLIEDLYNAEGYTIEKPAQKFVPRSNTDLYNMSDAELEAYEAELEAMIKQ